MFQAEQRLNLTKVRKHSTFTLLTERLQRRKRQRLPKRSIINILTGNKQQRRTPQRSRLAGQQRVIM